MPKALWQTAPAVESVPRCTFTDPEVASVGLSLEEARAKGHKTATETTAPMHSFDRAVCDGHAEGLVSIVHKGKKGAVLGATALGAGWDATLVETRCAALTGLQRQSDAASEWTALMERWPDDDEARLPAWLGLAELASASGDQERARELATTAMESTDDPGYISRAQDLLDRLGP